MNFFRMRRVAADSACTVGLNSIGHWAPLGIAAFLNALPKNACHCEPVWCSAQRIKTLMTASGSHTLIYAALVWQSPGSSKKYNRPCPHRPKMKKCAYIHTLKKCFGAGSSGGNVLVPARTLRRSRLKGRCRKAAPLRIPRPHRRKYPGMFRAAMGSSVGGTRIKNKSFNISTRFPAWEAGFSCLFNVYYIPTRIIGKYFSKPIDKIGI